MRNSAERYPIRDRKFSIGWDPPEGWSGGLSVFWAIAETVVGSVDYKSRARLIRVLTMLAS
eukprot:SAG31_NODE_558_length_14153_cov_9.068094_4_plen_61_part_00